jgi:hypothetical protein
MDVMTNKSDELRDRLLETCGPYEKMDVLRALAEALSAAIVETADTALAAKHNAAYLTDLICTHVDRSVAEDDKLN